MFRLAKLKGLMYARFNIESLDCLINIKWSGQTDRAGSLSRHETGGTMWILLEDALKMRRR